VDTWRKASDVSNSGCPSNKLLLQALLLALLLYHQLPVTKMLRTPHN
jgi:hypothetical protein